MSHDEDQQIDRDEFITAPIDGSNAQRKRLSPLRIAVASSLLLLALGAGGSALWRARTMHGHEERLDALLLGSGRDRAGALERARLAGRWVGTLEVEAGTREAVALVLEASPPEDAEIGLRFVLSGTSFVQRGLADFDSASGVVRLAGDARLASGPDEDRPQVLRAVAPWRGALRRIGE